ncbi:MAG: hypothetical protein QM820_55195 [Minicystis sp.]
MTFALGAAAMSRAAPATRSRRPRVAAQEDGFMRTYRKTGLALCAGAGFLAGLAALSLGAPEARASGFEATRAHSRVLVARLAGDDLEDHADDEEDMDDTTDDLDESGVGERHEDLKGLPDEREETDESESQSQEEQLRQEQQGAQPGQQGVPQQQQPQWQQQPQQWQQQPLQQGAPQQPQPWQGQPQPWQGQSGMSPYPYVQPAPVWSPYIGGMPSGGSAPCCSGGQGSFPQGRSPQGAAPQGVGPGPLGPGVAPPHGAPMQGVPGAGPMYGAPGGVPHGTPGCPHGAGPSGQSSAAEPGSAAQHHGSFGAGLGPQNVGQGAPRASGLGPLPGTEVRPWSPGIGIGPRAYGNLTGAR